ncbi:MAG: MFS transporter [Oscillospiraceae bacterium]|nr:MFS transporter [Oscillospiraceae bacterium]
MEHKPKTKLVVMTYGCMMLIGVVVATVNSTLVPLAAMFGTDLSQVSYLLSCLGIGRIVTQLFCGPLADRYGRKTIALIGLVLILTFFMTMPLLHSFALALAVSVVGGMGFGMVNTSMLALIFDCFAPVGRNSTAQCYVQLFYSLGGVITPVVANRLLTNGMDWSLLYRGCGFYALALLVAAAVIPFPPRYIRGTDEAGFVHKPRLMREGILICLAVFFIYSAGIVTTTWISAFSADKLGISDTTAVLVLAAYNIGCVAGTLFFAQLLKRVHGTILLIVNACVAFAAYCVCMLAKSIPLFLASVFAAGFVVAIAFNIGVGVGGELFSDNAATIAAMISVTSALSTLLLPAGTGMLLRAAGIRTAFSSVVVLSGIAVVVELLLRRRYLYLKGAGKTACTGEK